MKQPFLILMCGLLVNAGFLAAQDQSATQTQRTQNPVDALRRGDQQAAVKAAEIILQQDSDDPRVLMLAADVYLRCNRPQLAIPLYDRYIQIYPQSMPQLWQRGIALYFVGKHDDAVQQFVEHRRVNPHDVENAAWHFLCLAKAESFDKAQESVLPAPNDPRVPMAEVQQMLLTGNTSLVVKRMNEVEVGSRAYASAMFYGNFYLGLYADAQGDRKSALDKMSLAAKDAPHHYMGDVARVYAAYLKKTGDAADSDTAAESEQAP